MSGKCSVTVGGSVAAWHLDGFVFCLMDLLLAFSWCLFMSFCTLGDTVWKMSGLPIGGVLLKIASSYVLAIKEHAWAMNIDCRRRHGFSQKLTAWDFEVARARYADDILWVSGRCCHCCLKVAVSLAYPVPFDVGECAASDTWLDMELHLPDLSWRMKPILRALPPPWCAPKGYAHSFLCGRLARWAEVHLDEQAWLTAAVIFLQFS